jgi:hypothetical protein
MHEEDIDEFVASVARAATRELEVSYDVAVILVNALLGRGERLPEKPKIYQGPPRNRHERRSAKK